MKWEYESIEMCGQHYEDTPRFNELGKHGWELVCIECSDRYDQSIAIFKRPLADNALANLPVPDPKEIKNSGFEYDCPRQPSEAKGD